MLRFYWNFNPTYRNDGELYFIRNMELISIHDLTEVEEHPSIPVHTLNEAKAIPHCCNHTLEQPNQQLQFNPWCVTSGCSRSMCQELAGRAESWDSTRFKHCPSLQTLVLTALVNLKCTQVFPTSFQKLTHHEEWSGKYEFKLLRRTEVKEPASTTTQGTQWGSFTNTASSTGVYKTHKHTLNVQPSIKTGNRISVQKDI